MDKWECTVCGYVYDPAKGDSDGGIPPGSRRRNRSGNGIRRSSRYLVLP